MLMNLIYASLYGTTAYFATGNFFVGLLVGLIAFRLETLADQFSMMVKAHFAVGQVVGAWWLQRQEARGEYDPNADPDRPS